MENASQIVEIIWICEVVIVAHFPMLAQRLFQQALRWAEDTNIPIDTSHRAEQIGLALPADLPNHGQSSEPRCQATAVP